MPVIPPDEGAPLCVHFVLCCPIDDVGVAHSWACSSGGLRLVAGRAGDRDNPDDSQTRTGLSRGSNQSLFATGNSAGKGFDAARDGVGIFGGDGEFLAAETGLSGVCGSKAAGT